MTMMPTGVFSPVIHLRTLNLRYNRLADVGPQVFRSLPHLHDLDLQVRTPRGPGGISEAGNRSAFCNLCCDMITLVRCTTAPAYKRLADTSFLLRDLLRGTL